MRIMSMHKATPDMEAGLPPSQELLAGMGPLMGEMMSSGIFVAGEGLRPSSLGVRLRFSRGTRTITKGPLTGSNELVAAFAIVKTATIEEAIEFASRGARADAEIDVRPVTENWDLGFGPKPAGENKTRYMVIYKADKASESGARNTIADDPIVLTKGALQPSAKAIRLRFKGGRREVIDGPFAESKELIAGYTLLELSSIEPAIDWASRFAKFFPEIEIDIRPMYDES
jgi:hypothetical protein